MNLTLMLLPLIGGYVFLTSCNFTKFKTIFYSGYRLFFKSAFWGMILLVSATFILSTITELVTVENTIIEFMTAKRIEKFVVPTGLKLEGILAMMLGLVLLRILNYFYNADLCRKNAAEDRGDQLFLTVSESLVNVELIELTMANNEVYIGFPQGIKLNDEYIKIAPHFSGYRDSETKDLKITSKYYEIPQRRNIYISVKVKDVISVRIFR